MIVTAVIITHNEAHNLARCLESLKFCDEIVVVDAQSTDGTADIARQYSAKVTIRPWQGYVTQRNFAVSLASNDWILSIDADEEVSETLRNEIIQRFLEAPREIAFTVPRQTYHSKRWIRFGGWYPNRLVRLFRKSAGSWVGGGVHEYWQAVGPIGQLDGHLIHHSFTSIAHQVDRNNRYSSLGAETLHKAGVRFSLLKLFTKPVSKFLETYLLKMGFRDGFPGFIISVSAAYSVFLKWAKLWEFEKDHRTLANGDTSSPLMVLQEQENRR